MPPKCRLLRKDRWPFTERAAWGSPVTAAPRRSVHLQLIPGHQVLPYRRLSGLRGVVAPVAQMCYQMRPVLLCSDQQGTLQVSSWWTWEPRTAIVPAPLSSWRLRVQTLCLRTASHTLRGPQRGCRPGETTPKILWGRRWQRSIERLNRRRHLLLVKAVKASRASLSAAAARSPALSW